MKKIVSLLFILVTVVILSASPVFALEPEVYEDIDVISLRSTLYGKSQADSIK